MGKIYKTSSIVLITSLLLGSIVYGEGETEEKMRVAVIEFEEKGGGLGVEEGDTIFTDLLISKLGQTQKFELVERLSLNRILEEQRLGVSGVIDSKTAARVGAVYGVRGVIFGSINRIDDTLYFTARFVETETASIIKTADVRLVSTGRDLSRLDDKITELVELLVGEDAFQKKVAQKEKLREDLGRAQDEELLRIYEKDPNIAAALSAIPLLAGTGQLYNEDPEGFWSFWLVTGIINLMTTAAIKTNIDQGFSDPGMLGLGVVLVGASFGLHYWSSTDAYRKADSYNYLLKVKLERGESP